MSFQEAHARFRRLHQDSIAWKLLRAHNAPFILAFLRDLFAEENEVPYGRARAALQSELDDSRAQGWLEGETSAGQYLNQWIQAGWLRELDDRVSKTDACEVALRFCQGLDQRDSGTTASHLRIVQEAVRDFVLGVSPDVTERRALLQTRMDALQREMDDLDAGVVKVLSAAEQQERLREIYQLASVLTGDFRRVEDDIRNLDQELRVKMIEQDRTRGEVLQALFEKESLLAETDAGRAFEGFYQLLCDQNRSLEFREQLRSILSLPVARRLSQQQQQFLGQLMRELSRESERVFQVRRRTEESLRAYVESGALFENRAVDRLLGQLERTAISLREAGVDLKSTTALHLPTGIPAINSPDSLRLRSPDERLDTSGVEEQLNEGRPGAAILDALENVAVMEVADRLHGILKDSGPMTIAGLVDHHPLEAGLEELVACLRVARAVNAADLNSREDVIVRDRSGAWLKASIPRYLLSAELFPETLEELVI